MILLEQMFMSLQAWLFTSGVKILIGLLILSIGWKLIKRIVKIFNTVLEKRNIDPTIGSFLDGVINISLKILLILIVMDYVGLKTSSLVALVGSAGLAVGLALQGSLANFAGGVIILLIRPFNVGDLIDSGEHTGTVEKIGIFYTHLVTFDNKQILIPNGELANKSIVNYTSKDTRRVDLKFTVGYEQDLSKVKNALFSVINTEELILNDPPAFVAVSEHGDSAITFVVRVWTKTEDYWTVHFNLLERVKMKFDEENISIPYNQMDIHIKGNENI